MVRGLAVLLFYGTHEKKIAGFGGDGGGDFGGDGGGDFGGGDFGGGDF